ncbi:MetS family NSS transporter small subunit [Vibrio sp. SS-MA-C1-2]|nr:MetS family NSS transporter small subunit [Vibrio sp. SS-MA-C1-2]UJF19993.1 MetS family NSS transporter small subunit [Vibrio sp. SS-MA-C1-2]
MTTSAIVMMFIGLGVTWGGAVYCIRKAMRSSIKS